MLQNFSFLNEQGLIPGLEETESAFYQRIEFCQNLSFHLDQADKESFPFKKQKPAPLFFLKEAFDLTKSLYGISPTWVPVFFSNYQLTPWHAGCAWIFQLNEKTPLAAFLQLRAHFKHFPTYLGMYHRKELMAHELAHVGRLMLDELKFEEFFAYQTSPYRLRRWLGPLIQSSKESLFFIILLGLITFVDLVLLGTGEAGGSHLVKGLKGVCFAFVFLAFTRLIKRHFTLSQCLKKLKLLIKDPFQSSHLLYRLSDEEICQFAKQSSQEIQTFITNRTKTSFRWKFLNQVYKIDERSKTSHLT